MLNLEILQKKFNAWRKYPSFLPCFTWKQYFVAVLLLVVLTLTLSSNFLFVGAPLKIGDIAQKDITAPRTIEYIDKYKTEQLQNKAMDSVENVYDFNLEAVNQVKLDITTAFNKIMEIKSRVGTKEEKIKLLSENLGVPLSYSSLGTAISLSSMRLTELEKMGFKLSEQLLDIGIKEDKLPEAKSKLGEAIEALSLPWNEKQLLQEITQKTIAPNMMFNYVKTEREREKARQSVEPVREIIRKGLIIIRRGDQVTPAHVGLLEALGLQRARINYQTVGGFLLFNALILLVLGVYLWRYKREILEKQSHLSLLALILVLITLLSKLANGVAVSTLASYVSYLAPVAAGTMLITMLLDVKLALLVGVVLSAFVAIMNNNDLGVFIFSFFGGMAGLYSVSRLSQRDDLTRACLAVAGANMLAVLTIGMIYGSSWQEVLVSIVWAALNGVFSTVFTIGLLPFLEKSFAITTPITLLELANPNHPLLRKFLMEAPGTYHHSIVVANLAEAAAEKVGGDTLLVRVGAYYHDIGKLTRPYFFIENQFAQENPHDKISPSLSTLIITSHVKDGVELAREYKLPDDIQNIIRQHHGTTLVSYFYQRASDSGREDCLAEHDFRYPGPKPETKEAAIVMLADSIEAAVRSLSKVTPARIEAIVDKIIKEKLNDGQLDKCPLTLQDLDVIGQAFNQALKGIFHSRIEYPEMLMKEMEGGRAVNGSAHK